MSCHFTLENQNANAAIVRLFFTWMGCWVKINLMHGKKKVCNQFHMSFEGIVCRLIEVDGSMVGQNIIATRTLLLHLNCFFTLFCCYFTLRGGIDSRDESLVFTTRCVSCHHHHLMVMQLQKGFTFIYTDGDAYLLFIRLLFVILYFQRYKLHLFRHFKYQEDTN